MTIREVLVKVEYHGQVWYTTKQVTMEQIHEDNRQEGTAVNLDAIGRHQTSLHLPQARYKQSNAV